MLPDIYIWERWHHPFDQGGWEPLWTAVSKWLGCATMAIADLAHAIFFVCIFFVKKNNK